MNYKTAKKLKDAGFEQLFKAPFNFYYPDERDNNGKAQHCSGQNTDAGCYGVEISDGKIQDWNFENKYDGKNVNLLIKIPTLSELICACGKDFKSLLNFNGESDATWQAEFHNFKGHGKGKTPDEALSKLWLYRNGENK